MGESFEADTESTETADHQGSDEEGVEDDVESANAFNTEAWPDQEAGLEEGDEELADGEFGPDQELEIIGTDRRVMVTDTRPAPFRYICNLEYPVKGVGARPRSSGTLIGPRTVLTAGHCIVDRATGRLRTPGLMRVIPGRRGSLEPLPATTASRFVLFPGFRRTTATDLGIIHLTHPIGRTIGYWTGVPTRRKGDPVGTSILSSGALPLPPGTLKVNVSGYPGDKPWTAGWSCTTTPRPANRCAGTAPNNALRHRLCGAFPFRAYDVSAKLSGGILEYLNDTCPGHSGSPVWVRRHPSKGGRVLVAVHVSGDQPGPPVANRGVFITPAIRAWIVGNTV
jgi:V8-like Glu-specific endopeptidase